MCGRFRCMLSTSQSLTSNFDMPSTSQKKLNSENISPGDAVYVTVQLNSQESTDSQSTEKVMKTMIWGLVPSYLEFQISSSPSSIKLDHYKMFNCRVESATEKVSFKKLLSTRRCIVCIDGYYEFVSEARVKQPYFISFPSQPMYCAALYDELIIRNDESIQSFTILTTKPASNISWIHDRQPVILVDKAIVDEWLDPNVTNINHLLSNFQNQSWIDTSMKFVQTFPVTTKLNNSSYRGDDCSAPLKEVTPKLSSFFKSETNDFLCQNKVENIDNLTITSKNDNNIIYPNESITTKKGKYKKDSNHSDSFPPTKKSSLNDIREFFGKTSHSINKSDF